MATNDISEETEKRLLDFFNNVIDAKDMAKALRTMNYLLTLSVIRERDTMGKINLENFFYWVNELAEVLDPYLEVEQVKKIGLVHFDERRNQKQNRQKIPE